MKFSKIALVALFVGAGVVAIPLVTKNAIDKQLQAHMSDLKSQGIEAQKMSDEGYFNSKIKISYVISDGIKFKNSLFDKLITYTPSSRTFLVKAKEEMDSVANEAFEGMRFEADLSTSNLIPSDVSIALSITDFSTKAMEEIEKNEKAKSFFTPLLTNRDLTCYLDVDTNQKIKKFALKDLKLSDNEKFDIAILGTKLLLEYKNGVQGNLSINNQSYKFNDRYSNVAISFGQMGYDFDYKSETNNEGKISLNNFEAKETGGNSESSVGVGLFELDSKVGSVNNINLDILSSYLVRDFYLKDRNLAVLLDYLNFSLNFTKVSKEKLLELSQAYRDLVLEPNWEARRENSQKFASNLIALVNEGFAIEFLFGLKDIDVTQLKLSDIKGKLNLELGKNQIDFKRDRLPEILEQLKLKGRVSLNQNDIKELEKFDNSLSNFFDLGKDEGSDKVFNIELQGQNIFINNKKL